MSALPPAELSLTTLAALAELGPASPGRAAPLVTLPGSGKAFSAMRNHRGVTGEIAEKSATWQGGVTHARVLPAHDEANAEWEERAAILEYEGGWPRTLAEAIATRLMYFNQRDSTFEERRALDRELLALEQRRRLQPKGLAPLQAEGRRVPPRRSNGTGL